MNGYVTENGITQGRPILKYGSYDPWERPEATTVKLKAATDGHWTAQFYDWKLSRVCVWIVVDIV